MSGHSKWHSIKHKKGAADAKRGKLFAVLIRQIEVAARAGGGDPETNATLRTMVQKARDNSVPLDTIQRAIKRGTGEEEGVTYEAVSYEGYAPGGVAVIVQCLTDNRNRTGSEIKNIFSRNGGSFAEPGAVSWQFERKGIVAARQVGRLGRRADAGRRRRRCRRHRGPRRHVAGHDAADRAARGAHRDRGGRVHDQVRGPDDDPDDDASRSTTRGRPRQYCDSWTRSKNTTTSKRCTRTSTSRTRCSKRCRRDQQAAA